jgi:hypothetical protein
LSLLPVNGAADGITEDENVLSRDLLCLCSEDAMLTTGTDTQQVLHILEVSGIAVGVPEAHRVLGTLWLGERVDLRSP